MAHKPAVTVTAFRQWKSNVTPDYAILPDGCPDEGAIVLFSPMESVSKYDRITVDCRTFTDRLKMYEGLAPYIPLPDGFACTLPSFAEALCKSRAYITFTYCCVPLTHMRPYFIKVMRLMKEAGALEAVYGEDERDYPESFYEVDFTAGDTPSRIYRDPPRRSFSVPSPEVLW